MSACAVRSAAASPRVAPAGACTRASPLWDGAQRTYAQRIQPGIQRSRIARVAAAARQLDEQLPGRPRRSPIRRGVLRSRRDRRARCGSEAQTQQQGGEKPGQTALWETWTLLPLRPVYRSSRAAAIPAGQASQDRREVVTFLDEIGGRRWLSLPEHRLPFRRWPKVCGQQYRMVTRARAGCAARLPSDYRSMA